MIYASNEVLPVILTKTLKNPCKSRLCKGIDGCFVSYLQLMGFIIETQPDSNSCNCPASIIFPQKHSNKIDFFGMEIAILLVY